MTTTTPSRSRLTPWAAPGMVQDALHCGIDAWQRSVLFRDALRERGNVDTEHTRSGKPPVLVFDCDTVLDAREFELPANCALLRIKAPEGRPTVAGKRAFVVIDPRCGHGPGSGGFEMDSAIGVALAAGQPCCFVTFFPDPVPGQTIEAAARAEVKFLEKVKALHPDAEGDPFVIGNCQGGWALAMLAAARPDLVGPILLGGSWLASLTGDLGHGKFDGAQLVSNFAPLNPSNSCWTKLYDQYDKVEQIRANEQTIVYCLHEHIGHLGIFVSASVANEETAEITRTLDLIDTLPPGLYDLEIQDTRPDMAKLDLVEGRCVSVYHPREVCDILALDDGRDDAQELLFLAICESPLLAAALGMDAQRPAARPAAPAAPVRSAEVEVCFEHGSPLDAAMRILVPVGSADSGIDERPFVMIQRLMQACGGRLTRPLLEHAAKMQPLVLIGGEARAIAALPKLLPDAADARRALDRVREIASAQGELDKGRLARLARLPKALGLSDDAPAAVAIEAPAVEAEPPPRPSRPSRRPPPARPGRPTRPPDPTEGKPCPNASERSTNA